MRFQSEAEKKDIRTIRKDSIIKGNKKHQFVCDGSKKAIIYRGNV